MGFTVSLFNTATYHATTYRILAGLGDFHGDPHNERHLRYDQQHKHGFRCTPAGAS